MSRDSRLSYHAVPRIMKDEKCTAWYQKEYSNDADTVIKRRKLSDSGVECALDMDLWKSVGEDDKWKDFEEYIQDCRININVRQVLHQGQSSL